MITKAEVQRIAHLARLGLSDAETEKFAEDLSKILGYVSELQQLNTDGVEPIAHITGLENALREDDAQDLAIASSGELLVGQFPARSDSYLKVPPVLGER